MRLLDKGKLQGLLHRPLVWSLFAASCVVLLSVVYVLLLVLNVEYADQKVIAVFLFSAFVGFMIYGLAKFDGRYFLPFLLLSFSVVAYSEIQSVFVLRTYAYLGWPTSFLFWEYPLTIGLGWLYLSFCMYLVTNILVLGRERHTGFVRGSHYLTHRHWLVQASLIVGLAFIDGLFLFHIGVVNETGGVDLGYWAYVPNGEATFFGAPTRTLYTYFLAGFLINMVFRALELAAEKILSAGTQSLGTIDFLPLIPFFAYWTFLLVRSIIEFGFDHWMVFVTTPVLVVVIVATTVRFFELRLPTSAQSLG